MPMPSDALRIGADTGGTFTDLVAVEAGIAHCWKLASTPDDPAQAVLAGIAKSAESASGPDGRGEAGARTIDCVHGTTVGLNALLTGNHARVAWVTNDGHVDLIEIGRQDRLELYELEPSRTDFPVPRRLRFGIRGRRGPDGARLESLDDRELEELAATLERSGAAAIAVGLLHSPAAPADERRVARILRAATGLPITCSAELAPRSGEFERFAAACLNAAIQPVVDAYLARLTRGVRPGRVRLLRNSGGILQPREARDHPLRAVLSGPAGGVMAAARFAAAHDLPKLVAFDMGGTSTDVTLVDADPRAGGEREVYVAGLPIGVPAFDVHTIGCGGGSLAHRDAGGALRVGPRSAGAVPGPACYGKGDQPTVTDAHVALGHLGEATLLAGDFPIDVDRAVTAIAKLAKQLGTSPLACATGILEVAEVAMLRAISKISTSRGEDPANLPLLAFGGAGGLHAASLAQRLSMPCAWVPDVPGAFSALGLALASESIERLTPLPNVPVDGAGERQVAATAARLLSRARRELGDAAADSRIEARLRYAGQGSGLWLDLPSGPRSGTSRGEGGSLAQRFGALHEGRLGFALDDHPVEAVELRVRLDCPGAPLPRVARAKSAPAGVLEATRRPAPLGKTLWTVHRRETLRVGDRIAGPALIEESTTVLRVPASSTARVHPHGLEVRRP